MIITPADDLKLQIRLGESQGTRTTGVLHLSDVYKRFMERLQPHRFDTSKPMDKLRLEIGLLVENAIEREMATKFATQRPGELIGDMNGVPVYMTPDGVNPTYAAGEEYKATFMSSGQGLTDEDGQPLIKFVHWFVQMKGYAKWLGTNTFILWVLFLNGDYKWHKDEKGKSYPTGPQFEPFWVKFSDEEIEENWTMLTNFARSEGMLS